MPFFFIIFKRRHWQRYRYLVRQVDIRRTLIRAALYLMLVFALDYRITSITKRLLLLYRLHGVAITTSAS